MWRFVLVLMMATTFSCRSSDKKQDGDDAVVKQTGPASQVTKPAEGQTPEKDSDCQKRPAGKACCEALTPSCNDCREDNQKQQKDWEAKCLAEESLPPKCDKPPPVTDCCSEYTAACEECRQKAAAKLLAWKKACGTYEAHSCDAQPPTSMCCQAMIPSCQQCKDRNQRIREEWEGRCAGVEK